MIKNPISADSHITEPPHCYVDYIDPKFRDRAPRVERLNKIGDAFVIEGLASPIPIGLVAAAGKDPSRITTHGVAFEDLRSGWDAKFRVADQERGGVAAELIYPTVGMMLCNHPYFDFKKACFEAYNRWLQEYCGEAPDRLYGLAQVSMRTPEDGVAEILRAKEMGFKGVMMPGNPAVEDYDCTVYDKVWAAAVECDMPLSFHILTGKSDGLAGQTRGPRIQRLPVHHSRLPGCDGHLHIRRHLRSFSRPQGRVRRGRRGLGPTLHVSNGPRPQTPSLLDEGPAAQVHAERVFQGKHLCDLPG
jgi:uncharacterized protein